MMPGTYCPTTPSRAYSQRCTCAAPWRRARIDPRRRTCATPCCQAPRRSQYRARSASPPSALLQSCRKPGNKKVIKIATFLRLAIAADVQIADRAPKMKQNDRSVPHFHFTGDEKEPLIAKMLQKRQDFFFVRRITATGADSVMSQSPNGGKSRNELIAATRRTPHE